MGAHWSVREDPLFTRRVVARERLRLPAGAFPAWVLRGDSEFFGPADRVHMWYARQGLVRVTVHVEADAVDEAGDIVGRVVFDADRQLTALTLVR